MAESDPVIQIPFSEQTLFAIDKIGSSNVLERFFKTSKVAFKKQSTAVGEQFNADVKTSIAVVNDEFAILFSFCNETK